jgi:hypothetical protein
MLSALLLQHCTSLYISTMMARARMTTLCLKPTEIAEACLLACAAQSEQPQEALDALLQKSSVLAKYPAWKAQKRPASAMQQLDMRWRLPLQQLQATVVHALSTAAEGVPLASCSHDMYSRSYCWQGQVFKLRLSLTPRSTADQQGTSLKIELHLSLRDLPVGAVRSVTFQLSMTAPRLDGGQQQLAAEFNARGVGPVLTKTFAGGRQGQPNGASLGLFEGGAAAWSSVEATLRESGWVQADGCLHLCGCVTRLV